MTRPVDDPLARLDHAAPLEPEHFTDLGNARRLVSMHGQDLRYVHTWGKWLEWDTVHWAREETGGVIRRAKDTARGMYVEAGYTLDEDQRVALTKHAMKSESERALRAMVTLAQSEPGIPVTPDRLDADPWLLNCLNGTLDLRTAQLRPHRREDLITKLVPIAYDAAAPCPAWLAFLERVLAGRPTLIRFLQKAMGYALTGDTSEQVLFILYGTGANGKTTCVDTVRVMLGDYARSTPAETFLAKSGDDHHPRNDLARLQGARLVVAVEGDAGKRIAESLVKQLTGGDVVTARFLYQEQFEFLPTFKLVLVTNHKPVIRGTDHAMWRRIRLVPFTVTIPPEEQDRDLPRKLRAELPGILRWAVDGYLAWQHEGLGMPDEVRDATEAFRAEMDVLGDFLAERCILADDGEVSARLLYEAYLGWSHEAGEKPLTKKAFGLRLAEKGPAPFRTNAERGWRGVGLRDVTHDASRDAVSSNPTYARAQGGISENRVTDTSPVTDEAPEWVRK